MKTQDAIDFYGSASSLARKLGVSRQAVSSWGDTVPPLRAIQIERITRGKLKADWQSIMDWRHGNARHTDVSITILRAR